jgi:hypothetical protein
MKITFEATGQNIRRVEITVGGDDLIITEVWEDLIRPALLAYGYHPTSVDSLEP